MSCACGKLLFLVERTGKCRSCEMREHLRRVFVWDIGGVFVGPPKGSRVRIGIEMRPKPEPSLSLPLTPMMKAYQELIAADRRYR